MYLLLISIFSLLGIGIFANAFFPYEVLTEQIVDNQINYFLNQLIYTFLAMGTMAWVFVFAFLIGKTVGEDDLEKSS